jgi:hypothetical protein
MDIDISINEYREFVSENPYEEIWRQLYYFTDVDSVNEKIRKRFNLKEKEQKDQPKRRAQKIAYSIIQAHNYFKAANQVDVSVKPNLIYYGISSLANTVIEYNNDGKFSRGDLQNKKQEKHHGLDDMFPFKSLKKDTPLQDILKNISCIIHTESQKTYKSYGLLADVEYDEENMELKKPYGHFKDFYNSIVHECVFINSETNILGQNSYFTGILVAPFAEKVEIENLFDRKFDLLSMFGFLPDMVQQFFNNGIISNLCTGEAKRFVYKSHLSDEPKSSSQNNYHELNFSINQLSSEKKEYFKNLCLQNKSIQKEESPRSLLLKYDSRIESENNYLPDMVQDIFGKIYFIYNVEEYIQELANLYICFFCTGMLCRYYPDYWMHWIEKNVGFKHLMETLCSIAIRKFPNLILNQLTQCINHFHL